MRLRETEIESIVIMFKITRIETITRISFFTTHLRAVFGSGSDFALRGTSAPSRFLIVNVTYIVIRKESGFFLLISLCSTPSRPTFPGQLHACFFLIHFDL